MSASKPHKHRPLEFAALDDSDAPECPVCREYNNEEFWRLLEQLETLRAAVEKYLEHLDEAGWSEDKWLYDALESNPAMRPTEDEPDLPSGAQNSRYRSYDEFPGRRL